MQRKNMKLSLPIIIELHTIVRCYWEHCITYTRWQHLCNMWRRSVRCFAQRQSLCCWGVNCTLHSSMQSQARRRFTGSMHEGDSNYSSIYQFFFSDLWRFVSISKVFILGFEIFPVNNLIGNILRNLL